MPLARVPRGRAALAAASLLVLVIAAPARADMTLGAVLSLTGPAAALGIPEQQTIALLPKMIAGQAVHWVVLDDASDPTAAVKATRKLIEEDKADIIIGPSTTPTSLAILPAVAESGTPMISLSGSGSVIEPPDGAKRWAFKLVVSEKISTNQMADDMAKHGAKTLAQIGFSNSLGDGYIGAMMIAAPAHGVKPVAETRYNPTDTSVTPQVLRMLAAKPDAVFVVGSGTPGILPMIELRNRGFSGLIYTVQGITSPEALRVGGKALDGTRLSADPMLVAEELPDGPVKTHALDYVHAFEGANGAGSRNLFGATLWDAFLLTDAGAQVALKTQPPGTAAFRLALRDAMEHVAGMAGAEGMFTLTPTDHSGIEPDSQVMVVIQDHGYKLAR
jgi:branched-chain amino acid transport system substrate-binding protein